MEINFSELNWFDITIISIVVASTLFAVLRGFIKSIFSLFTWVSASIAGAFLYPYILPLVTGHVKSDKVAMAIASFGTFTLFFIIFAIISYKIVHMMDGFRGGVIDRILGVGFGYLRGVVIVSFMFFSINMTSEMLHFGSEARPGPEWFASAKTYDRLKSTTKSMFNMLPEDVPNQMVKYINKIKDASLAAAGTDDADGGNGLPRTLNAEERKIMKKVISALPKDEMTELYKRYEGGVEGISDIQKLTVFREILTMYNTAVAADKITKENLVSESELKTLDLALNGSNKEPEAGAEDETAYKKLNIKQLDRLVGNVEDGSNAGEGN